MCHRAAVGSLYSLIGSQEQETANRGAAVKTQRLAPPAVRFTLTSFISLD